MFAQERREEDVVVNAESDEAAHNQFTELGEYGQPAWAERNRLSSTTSVYVLSPYELFFGSIWEGDFRSHGKSRHDFTQQIDLGLPHRFEIGLENELGVAGDTAHETAVTIETRYAFANWNALPLNPAISAEYVVGAGRSVTERPTHRQSDAVAVRALFGQNFGDYFGYGINLGLEQDLSHDSERQIMINQAFSYATMNGRLELGGEMRYTHRTFPARSDSDELIIGPDAGWKPVRQLRIAFAPLFGCTSSAPRVATFLLVSYEFGGAEAMVTPVPRD